ncbi:MAG: T9SS type A sorting domain-containing protein, partial [Bacteroidota bacterium]
VTDANGCMDVVMATVDGEGEVTLAVVAFTDASCGLPNGSITVAPTNGVAPFVYTWDHDLALTGPIAENLTAGPYSVMVTDANGCTAEATQVIGGSPAVDIIGETITPTSCDADNGVISVVVTGGTGALTYDWVHDEMATGSEVTGLPAGSYSLTVTDELGCEATATFTVDNEDGPVITASTVEDALCTDGSGQISVTVEQGQPPYTYAWDHDANLDANVATNLLAGDYFLVVTDANGCTVEGNFSVAFFAAPSLSLVPSNPDCGLPNTGSILPEITGGTAPFTYSWSDMSAGTTLDGIPAGDYSLTITDANGCMAMATATIEDRPNPEITVEEVQDIPCAEVLGTASFLVINVTEATTYDFSDDNAMVTETDLGNGQARITVTNIGAGIFTFSVETDQGCTDSENVEVVALPAFQLVVVDQSPTSCEDTADGSAEVGIIGSDADFTFSWDAAAGNQTGPLASGLAAGTYTVTAASDRGCMISVMVTISAPTALSVTEVDRVNIGCFGEATGELSVIGSGGTAPYTYAWRGDTLPAFQSLTNLPAGEYEVTVTDANNCSEILRIILTQPTEILPGVSVMNNACAESATGSITVMPTGGAGGYTYVWPDFPGETGPTVENVAAGTYSVEITDADGCLITAMARVEDGSSPITISVITQMEVSCPEVADGSITVEATGDNGPFTYSWSNGGAGATISDLAGGQSYIVTATNALGCTETLMVDLEGGTSIELMGFPADTAVCLGNFYTLDLADYPGTIVTGPGGFSESGDMVFLEVAGDYLISYTNADGCTAEHTLTLSVTVDPFTAQIVMASDITVDQQLIVLEASYPAPDNVAWVFDEANVTLVNQDQNLYYFEFAVPGTYDIGMVADAGGCSDVISKQVIVHADSTTIPGAVLGASEIIDLVVAPNPSFGAFSVNVTLTNPIPFTMTIYRENGEQIVRRESDGVTSITEAFDLDLIPGTYFLQAQAGAERRMVAVIIQ